MRNFLLFTAVALCCALPACTEVIFTHKAKGRIPTEFAGEYYLEIPNEDGTVESAFVTVKHLEDAMFAFVPPDAKEEDTMVIDLVARGNDYFINWPDDSLKDHWRITSFRIIGDSAYNFLEALSESAGFEEFEVEELFRRYEKEVISEDHTRYIVDNRRRETIKAFRAHNDKAVQAHKSILFKKVEPAQKIEALPDQLNATNELRVGPNPFQEAMSVQLPAGKTGDLRLLDINGKKIRESLNQNQNLSWNLKELSSGVYFLQWESGKDIQTIKVIKE
jgi:methionine-rich copper-binding protein CopC